jgi:glycosyltransferase involved in cell wall biosynthesis
MAASRRVIVSVTNDLYTDQRVHKVCLFLISQGYSVLLVGRKRKNSIPLPPRDYKTKRLNLFFDQGAFFYAEFNIRLFLFLLFKRSNVLLANDLDTLLANYAASKFKPTVELVYDSHEYFTEVPELINRPKTQKIWLGIEKWIFPKLNKIYTVNQSIATIYKEKYKKEIKVIRNISPLWGTVDLKTKKELRIPENKKLIILQGAGINIDRGAEEAVEAMKLLADAVLMIVGDGDVIQKLKKTVQENKLTEKVLFFGKKPYKEMMNYTYYADLGLTLDKPTNLNYQFSLPNKVFDYMHTATPIISTNLIEISNLINQYNIGKIIPDLSPENLAKTIQQVFANPTLLEELKHNCLQAKEKENWEKESIMLKELFPRVE